MRFTIRDVLWLTVVVAMAVGWWDASCKLAVQDRPFQAKAYLWEYRAKALAELVAEDGWKVDWPSDGVRMTSPTGSRAVFQPNHPTK